MLMRLELEDQYRLCFCYCLSDQKDMVGGDLRVLQLPDASNTEFNLSVFETLQAQGVPEE